MNLALSIIAALSIAAASASAQPAYLADLDKIDDVNPYVIKSVMVDGNKLIPRGQIKAVIKTKAGDFYHRKDMEEDLKAVNKLGYFEAGELHIEANTTAAGMVILIHVKENPFFKSITFSGNKIIPSPKLQELFKNQLQKPQSTSQMAAALKTITNDYKDQGYLLAHATIAKSDEKGNVTVDIDEGIIQDIKLVCSTDEQKAALQSALTLKAGEPYNEKKLAGELKAAYKTGKFENLDRDVVPLKGKGAGYVLTIKATTPETPKTASEDSSSSSTSSTLSHLRGGGKGKSVLNHLIKSETTIYKNIK